MRLGQQHRFVLGTFLAVTVTSAVAAPAAAATPALELRYAKTATETTTPGAEVRGGDGNEAPAGPTTTESAFVVRLEPDRIAIRDGAMETIYDFAAGTRVYLDHAARTAHPGALHAEVAFRSAELANRVKLHDVFASAGIDENPFDIMELETLFSMETGASEERVSAVEAGDSTTFSVAGRELARVKLDERGIPETLRDALRRFLVYGCRLHPDVRRRIVETGRAPGVLVYRFTNTVSRSEIELRLQAVGADPEPIRVPSGYAPPEPDGALGRALARLDELSSASVPSADRYRAEAASLAAAGQPADAVLTLLELILATGDQSPDSMRELMASSAGDERVDELVAAVQAGEQDPDHAAALNRAIDRDDLAKGYVLDIFLANYLTARGETAEAVELFVGALAENPFITGVYKDLGDIRFSEYDMEAAWRCWDAAREIWPGHPMLDDVGAYERRLEAGHPDFY